jgi:hypothetical protein
MKLPKRLATLGRRYLPKPSRRSIKLDTISSHDFNRLELRFFCDDCSHYAPSQRQCTLGYRARHTRAEQKDLFELTGKMALCRAIEID